jgi:hypothetical protein
LLASRHELVLEAGVLAHVPAFDAEIQTSHLPAGFDAEGAGLELIDDELPTVFVNAGLVSGVPPQGRGRGEAIGEKQGFANGLAGEV